MNAELASAFERIADLLEISGADKFRTNSYRRVSRAIRDLQDDVTFLHESGVLTEVEGVGKGTAAKIVEYIETGHISLLDELTAKLPAGLPELLKIQGMGPKKVALVYNELKVESINDLKAAIESGALESLPGMGKQSAHRIAEGIEFLERSKGRTPLGLVQPVAEALLDMVKKLPGVQQAQIAGSLRRGVETIGDVDILCATDKGKEVIDAFIEQASPKRVLASGQTKGSIVVAIGDDRDIQVDLRAVPKSSFGAALQYFTGSKEHNVRLRERAIKNGWKLNEWGLFDGEKSIAGADENDIYARLELPCPPPEVREDRFEFDDGFDASSLVSVDDLRGDLHMHTSASDGHNSIDEMAAAAKRLGYKYIVITDHSRSSTIANGLSIERMQQHIADVRAADERIKGLRILTGTECDILSDGKLDYPDDVLAECDVVVASIHTAMEKGKRSPTERIVAAIENKYVTIIGHPTGRLLSRRPAMELDMPRIAQAAASSHTVLEINASWQRLDLCDRHARIALESGAFLSIDTDAHGVDQLERIKLGVLTARRAGATGAQVINTFSFSELTRFIARKRG